MLNREALVTALWMGVLCATVAPGLAQEKSPCDEADKRVTAGSASVAQTATESSQPKSWQPVGGEVLFTLNTPSKIDVKDLVLVCFRWKARNPAHAGRAQWKDAAPTRVELNAAGTTLKVAARIPDLGKPSPSWFKPEDKPENAAKFQGEYAGAWLVPLAEVRILVRKEGPPATDVADARTLVGISNIWWAIAFALATLAIALTILSIWSHKRLTAAGLEKVNWLLRLITTTKGTASLSQFQIVLWTFLVGASAVYVMALSGELIQISTGTLVLLGIAGASTVGSALHGANQDAAAKGAAAVAVREKTAAEKDAQEKAAQQQAAANQAKASADALANAAAQKAGADKAAAELEAKLKDIEAKKEEDKAEALKAAAQSATADKAEAVKKVESVAALKTPQWSDLVVNENEDGSREIDVTRVQMLYFTLIAAGFVAMRILSTYVIPDIPDGFQILMGISNGVYMGAKITQK